MNIKELKKLYQDFMSMFEDQNETVRKVVFSEFVFFMIYFAGVDKKISAKEVKFIEDITGNEVTNMSDVYQQLKAVSFKERIPKTLAALVKTDKDYDADFENSMSLKYLRTLYEIGDALIKVDGVKDSERKESMEYFAGLLDYCKSQLGEETKPNVSKKKKEPARETTQSRSSNKGKRKKTTDKQTNTGGWIKASQYIPTGIFLDDVFRHQDLSYEDRVKIWESLIGESLPCQWLSDMKYKKPAWFGYNYQEQGCYTVPEVYELIDMPENKPIYYYSVVYAQFYTRAVGTPAGMMVNHQGIFLYWEKHEYAFIPWDSISKVRNLVEIENLYRIELEIMEDWDCPLAFDDDLPLVFPKPGKIPNMVFPQKKELENLVKLMRTRLSQIDEFRGKTFMIESDSDYFNLAESTVKKICEDYLLKSKDQEKTSSRVKTRPDSKQTGRNGKKTQKIVQDTNKEEISQIKKARSHRKANIGKQKEDPVTYLEFWQKLKPRLEDIKDNVFATAKAADFMWMNGTPNVIQGVFHSIGIQKTKKTIRLETAIATGNVESNLQIVEYVKKNVKLPKKIKDRVVFDIKQGRKSQKSYLVIHDFIFEDRSCWDEKIDELISLIDDYMGSIDAAMKELV